MTNPFAFLGFSGYGIITPISMITEIVYFKREGDEILISEMQSNLEKLNHKELLDAYGKLVCRGLVAAHGQALYLLAMRTAFFKLFVASPIKVSRRLCAQH